MTRVTRKLREGTLGTLLLSLAVACRAGADWDGVYTFTDKLGDDPGAAAMLVEYRLGLDGDRCEVTVAGYQADTHILCALEISGETAVIRFRSYGNGEVKSVYGVEVYKVGEPLFILRHSPPAPKILVTEWGALIPDGVEEKTGAYFSTVN